MEIDHCHHMGKFQRKKSKPWTLVCKFLCSKDKHKVLQNVKKLKNTGIFFYDDFSKSTMELRKSPWEEVLQHHQQNKIACLNYRCIVVKDCIVNNSSFVFANVSLFVFSWCFKFKMNPNMQEICRTETPKYYISNESNDILLDNAYDPDLIFFSKNGKHVDTVYVLPEDFHDSLEKTVTSYFSILHLNIPSIKNNFESFKKFCLL